MRHAFDERRKYLIERLNTLPGIRCNMPGGAFYAFVKAPSISGSKFAEKAIANNVLIIPGNVFSEKDTHFRISYATSNEKIEQGVEILSGLV